MMGGTLGVAKVERRVILWPGALGTAQTLGIMREYIRKDAADPGVRWLARWAVKDCTPNNNEQYADALRAGLLDWFPYQRDPRGTEELTRPARIAAEIIRGEQLGNDCDDSAMLGAAMALAVGMRARLRAMVIDGPLAPFRHVRAESLSLRGWHSLDVAFPAAKDSRPPMLREV